MITFPRFALARPVRQLHSPKSLCWIAAILLLLIPKAHGQEYQELYSFGRNPDGNIPMGELVEGDDGNFYGTTYYGGPSDCGTVFKITPGGALTIIAALDGSWGRNPCYSLVKANDGNFYGTTYEGSVFRVTPNGTITYLDATVAPAGSFIQGTDGYIYGALAENSSSYGWVFRSSLDWSTGAILHEFTWDRAGQDGIDPEGGLIQGRDGSFYGTTSLDGAYGCGTVYKITSQGQLTTICSFLSTNGARYPYGSLLQASDGNFYGAADGGGSGTLFKASPTGALSTIYEFVGIDNTGEDPNGSLIQGNDGNLYGTARSGTSNNLGTVFKVTPSGTVTAVLAFTGSGGRYPGANPYAGLVQGSDGNLYGTTGNSGTHGSGNVFRIIMPGPQLNSFRFGQQFVVSWRTNYVGYQLEGTIDPQFGSWSAVTNAPTLFGGQFFITNSIGPGSRFFRLKK